MKKVSKKAIALVVVVGGVAYEYAPKNVNVRVVDIDNIEEDGERQQLPKGIGFEKLVKQANVGEYVDFVEPKNVNK